MKYFILLIVLLTGVGCVSGTAMIKMKNCVPAESGQSTGSGTWYCERFHTEEMGRK
jgi:hypothetical protein